MITACNRTPNIHNLLKNCAQLKQYDADLSSFGHMNTINCPKRVALTAIRLITFINLINSISLIIF